MSAVKKARIEWLDAMRGFTMILVVANHVSQLGFLEHFRYSVSLSFLMIFRMPLFFFISGFLAYRSSFVWNWKNMGALISKKLQVQLIPTFVFFLLWVVLLHDNFYQTLINGLISSMKGGYWFTISLLYMLIAYYIFSFVESRMRWRSWIPITLLFLFSLVVYETCYLPQHFSWAQGYRGTPNVFLCRTSLVRSMMFFPFFLLGNIVHRYWGQAQKLMDSSWFYPVVIVVAVFSTLEIIFWHTLRMEWQNLPYTIAKFSLLLIVFMYFRYYAPYFSKSTVIGSSLQYIGRRTLDIYLIHFLFIPNLPTIGAFFGTYRHNFVIDTTLSVMMSLLIIAFCIITSNILRISPFLRKYLFGR